MRDLGSRDGNMDLRRRAGWSICMLWVLVSLAPSTMSIRILKNGFSPMFIRPSSETTMILRVEKLQWTIISLKRMAIHCRRLSSPTLSFSSFNNLHSLPFPICFFSHALSLHVSKQQINSSLRTVFLDRMQTRVRRSG